VTRDLYAVLITLPGGDTLLLPNAAVVEVLSMEGVAPAGGPAWLAGRCQYNGRPVPVVNFEVLNGAPAPEASARTRVTVLNGITTQLAGGQFAVLSQGYPHLVTLNANAVVRDTAAPADSRDLIVTRVRIANTKAAIPNLEAVEREIAEAEAAGATGEPA